MTSLLRYLTSQDKIFRTCVELIKEEVRDPTLLRELFANNYGGPSSDPPQVRGLNFKFTYY